MLLHRFSYPALLKLNIRSRIRELAWDFVTETFCCPAAAIARPHSAGRNLVEMTDQPTPARPTRQSRNRISVRSRVKSRLKYAVLAGGLALMVYAGNGLHQLTGDTSSSAMTGARQIAAHPNLSRVIDADTIVVGDIRVRLDGISAPERGHDAYTKGKWFVADLMRDASMVECALEGRKSHDREVGACHFIMPDGRRIDPQAEAVRAGFARDCPRYSGGRYRNFETPASRSLPLPTYC